MRVGRRWRRIELADAINAVEQQMPMPRSHVCHQIATKRTLARQLSELGEIIRSQIDPLFQPLRRTNPALFVR